MGDCHTIPYHTIPYHTTLCHTTQYHTIPHHTTPYHNKWESVRECVCVCVWACYSPHLMELLSFPICINIVCVCEDSWRGSPRRLLRRPMPIAHPCSPGFQYWNGEAAAVFLKIATWLILPEVIRSSQRLSHACLSISINTSKLRMAHYISYSLIDNPLLLGYL